EDQDEDEDEDEEEDEDEARAAPVRHGSAAAKSDDWLPDWAPMAVLIVLLAVGFIGGLGFFSSAPPADNSAVEAPAAPAQAQQDRAAQPIQVRRINPSDIAKGH